MTRAHRLRAGTGLLLAFLLLGANVSAAADLVPVHATINGVSTFGGTFVCPAGSTALTINGTGTMAHLGRLQQYQEHCQAAAGPSQGEYWFTAANGDTIFGHYQSINGDPSDPTAVSFTGVWVIDGGTGRFAGATGGGTAEGQQNFITGEARLLLDGDISRLGG